MKPDLAIVMPAYNEADGIGEFLEDLAKAVADRGLDVVFCIADDHSTDSTAATALAEASRLNIDLSVDTSSENMGHGPTSVAAWRAGVDSGAPVVVHVDGDGQFDGAAVLEVAAAVTGDGALGIRTSRADPWFRKVLTRLLRLYIRMLSGKSLVDANTPLRAYRADVLARMLGELPSQPLIPSIYLSAIGETRGFSLSEVKVASRDRRGTTSTGTMWGRGRWAALLPSRRLVSFVFAAISESFAVLRRLR